jgi:hypothetical protein
LVLTSPPYGASLHGQVTPCPGAEIEKRDYGYSRDRDNLAHVGLDRLIAGMIDILTACTALLLPGGIVAMTVRPYWSLGALVDLPGRLTTAITDHTDLTLFERNIPRSPASARTGSSRGPRSSGQRAGTFIDPAAGKTTVSDWVQEWLPALDVSIRTEEGYRGMVRNHILPRWGTTALSAVSGIQVAAWTEDLHRKLAPATVSSILKLFTMIMADAAAERLIAYNPVQPRRRGRPTQPGRSNRSGPTPRKCSRSPTKPQHATARAGRC